MDVSIVNRVSVILIVGTLLMTVFDGDDHPPISEMVRIEMSRVFTLPGLQTAFPSFEDVLDASLAREILCQPWEARMSTAEVVHTLATRMDSTPGFPATRFLDELEYHAIRSDPVVYALLRRGMVPVVDDERTTRVIRACCGELGCAFADVVPCVTDFYTHVWSQNSV